MSDVKVLRLAEEAATVNEITVQRCKELLKSAKAGELRGFIVVGETPSGELFEGGSELYDLPLLMMGLEMAKQLLHEAVLHGGPMEEA